MYNQARMTASARPKETSEEKITRLTNVLTNGVRRDNRLITKGWMRKTHRFNGCENRIMDHQRRAVQTMLKGGKNHRFIFNHAMGAGKTVSAIITMLANNILENNKEPCLIVAPKATLYQWKQTILGWTVITEEQILHTSCEKDINTETLANKLVVITTPACVSNAFKTSFRIYDDWKEYYDARGSKRYKKGWGRKGMTRVAAGWYQTPEHHARDYPLHALFRHFGLVILDEVHVFRTTDTIGNEAIRRVTKKADRVLGLTGTLIYNKPVDLVGISVAMGIHDSQTEMLTEKKVCSDSKNVLSIMKHFKTKYTHRVAEEELNLPAITMKGVDFALDVYDPTGRYLSFYNDKYNEAVELRHHIEQGDNGAQKMENLAFFVSALNTLQQFAVSPLLATRGCEAFKRDPSLFKEAVKAHEISGCMKELSQQLTKLKHKGHSLIVVASDKVVPMLVLKEYVNTWHAGEFGDLMEYTGALSEHKRNEVKSAFLKADRAILFLSIKAGGCGLDLIPGCEAMVFVGPIPFSPASFLQCTRRIYRVGQTCARTGSVDIVVLVSHSSIDHGVCKIHFYKQQALDWVQDGVLSKTDDQGDVMVTCRILDNATVPSQGKNGYINFPPMVGKFDLMPSVSVQAVNSKLG